MGEDRRDRGKPRSNPTQAVNDEGGCSGRGQETKILGRVTRSVFKKKSCGWREGQGGSGGAGDTLTPPGSPGHRVEDGGEGGMAPLLAWVPHGPPAPLG